MEAVSLYSSRVASKLGRGGETEEQLRAPIEELIRNLGGALGLEVIPYGEVRLREFGIRPDYAVDIGRDRIGYIELKAPGTGVPPDWKKNSQRNNRQYERMRDLPNILYSDGISWTLLRSDESPRATVKFDGDIGQGTLIPPSDGSFHQLINAFFSWTPQPPKTLAKLIKLIAGPCRILCASVAELLALEGESPGAPVFTRLREDWRTLLFPGLPDEQFPDAYAQTITFALLLAREGGITFQGRGIRDIAEQLTKQNPLMGRALHVLSHDDAVRQLKILDTLRIIIGAVDWQNLPQRDRAKYWDLYEPFLKEYDKGGRQRSGSYYTPEPVAGFVVEFVDHILKDRLDCIDGFAADDVFTMDPAMGTGTFLIQVLRSAAKTSIEEHNLGFARAVLRDLCRHRLIGFERSAAPYVVAELRVHQTLKEVYEVEPPEQSMRFLTNTLSNPSETRASGLEYAEITESRDRADNIKRKRSIVAIVGNPPYVTRARQRDPAPWIEKPRLPTRSADLSDYPALDDFRLHGNGQNEYALSNTGTYFWRWSTWKVFDAHPEHRTGVVALITTSAYLRGIAFAGMRRYLRKTCDEGWIIDLSPEGQRPDVPTRVFKDVKEPICIGIFLRTQQDDNSGSRAIIRYRALEGSREGKFAALASNFPLDGDGWRPCQDGWTDDFLPSDFSSWTSYPQIDDLIQWGEPGMKPGLSWVYAPRPEVLQSRWARFSAAKNKDILFKDLDLAGRRMPVSLNDAQETPRIEECAFRSFDRQYVLTDRRLIDRFRAPLWQTRSPHQVYASIQHDQPIKHGPGVIFTELVPDQHHFAARGGRVLPLYKHRQAQDWASNIPLDIRRYLTVQIETEELVTPEDALAYIAAVTAHSGYTQKFWDSLRRPGIRVPITTDKNLWREACDIGSEVIWLHTFGRRYHDVTRDRPHRPPRLPEGQRPEIIVDISDEPDAMPDEISYDSTAQHILIGDGVIGPVRIEAWNYQVCGRQVIRQWFSFRQRTRQHQRRTSALDDDRVKRWTVHLSRDLLNLINVLTMLVDLEARQESLLQRICDGPQITVADLERSGLLPAPASARKAPRQARQDELHYEDDVDG